MTDQPPSLPATTVPRTGNPATDRAIALLLGLYAAGVRHVVLSPGSRSQALALAAAALERGGMVRLHVRIDERVAGFLALGIGRQTGAPAVVITTSGTAGSHLHPAVLEAHESGIPLIVITADRPHELRGIRSNQTTRQDTLYGQAVRLNVDLAAPETEVDADVDALVSVAEDAVRASVGAQIATPGPVHLNVAFREPLSGALPDVEPAAVRDHALAPRTAAPASLGREILDLTVSGDSGLSDLAVPTIVIAGADAGPHAEEFARSAGFPLIAEISSGSRFGPNLIVPYRTLLADSAYGGRVRRAYVFGHPTLSREVPALLARSDVEVTVIALTGADVYNPGRRARVVGGVNIRPTRCSRHEQQWLSLWRAAHRAWASSVYVEPDDMNGLGQDGPVTRAALVDAVWSSTTPADRLLFAASRLIREADRRVPGKRIRVHANRGLAGIDGTIATALGIALATDAEEREPGTSPGITRALLGDLAFLHDVGGLLMGAGEAQPRLQLIVGNDGGGTIFDGLEVAFTAEPAAFDRVQYTPHRVAIAAIAAAYGITYGCARTDEELVRALAVPPEGISILEVPLAR